MKTPYKPLPLSRVDRFARWMLSTAPSLFLGLALLAFYLMDDWQTAIINLLLAGVYQLMSIEQVLLDE